MSTLCSMFVRVPSAATAAHAFDALSKTLASERQLELRQHPEQPWIEVRYYGGLVLRMPEARLAAEISRRMGTEVVLAQIQTAASVLGLARFENGVERRAVEVSDGSPWTARGTPEAWETHLFPPASEVEDVLNELFGDDADLAEQEAMRKLYATRVIVDGQPRPFYVSSLVFEALSAVLGMAPALGNELRGFEEPSRMARTPKRLRFVWWTVLAVGAVVLLLLLLRGR